MKPDGGAVELFASHPDMQFPNGTYVDVASTDRAQIVMTLTLE
ncbi:MAG TPA: hypothetical protein VNM90_05060 [Haliangium sp.]|nr:hypothetical protein [Haliangium sp.]